MAIKLKVIGNDAVRLKVGGSEETVLHVGQGVPIYPSPYVGEYEVTPSALEQILATNGLMKTGNVKINPIPSNYGLITYNGSVITVS